MTKENKKVNKGDIQSTDSAGFQIRNGELSVDNPTEQVVSTPNVSPEVPENEETQKVAPDVPKDEDLSTEDPTSKSIVDQINEAPSNIVMNSDEIHFEGTIDYVEANKIEINNKKDFERVVEEVLRGQHGSGRERMLLLGENYAKVQAEVNKRLR